MEKHELDYQTVFEANLEAIVIAMADGTMPDANPGVCRVVRRSREDATAVRLEDMFDSFGSQLRSAPSLQDPL